MRTVGRVFWVPIVFTISALVALYVLVTLGAERIVQELHVEQLDEEGALGNLYVLWQQLRFIGGAASMLSVVPGLIVVIVGEAAGIRSAVYYVLGGGAALAAIPLLGQMAAAEAIALPSATVMQVFATAGFAAGLVYWLLAGRTAG